MTIWKLRQPAGFGAKMACACAPRGSADMTDNAAPALRKSRRCKLMIFSSVLGFRDDSS